MSDSNKVRKPREFWIIGNEVYLVEQDIDRSQVTFHVEQIHVREVVTIDWEKVWDTYNRQQPNPYEVDHDAIQELVEEQLSEGAGEGVIEAENIDPLDTNKFIPVDYREEVERLRFILQQAVPLIEELSCILEKNSSTVSYLEGKAHEFLANLKR